MVHQCWVPIPTCIIVFELLYNGFTLVHIFMSGQKSHAHILAMLREYACATRTMITTTYSAHIPFAFNLDICTHNQMHFCQTIKYWAHSQSPPLIMEEDNNWFAGGTLKPWFSKYCHTTCSPSAVVVDATVVASIMGGVVVVDCSVVVLGVDMTVTLTSSLGS